MNVGNVAVDDGKITAVGDDPVGHVLGRRTVNVAAIHGDGIDQRVTRYRGGGDQLIAVTVYRRHLVRIAAVVGSGVDLQADQSIVIGSWRQGKRRCDVRRDDFGHIGGVSYWVDACARGGQAGQRGTDDVDPLTVGI